MRVCVVEEPSRGLKEGRYAGERNATGAGTLAAFGIAAVALIFATAFVTAYELVAIVQVMPGVKLSFDVPYYLRFGGMLLLGIGLFFIGWVFRYRHPRDFFASTWVTIRTRARRSGIEVGDGRTEPFVPLGPYCT